MTVMGVLGGMSWGQFTTGAQAQTTLIATGADWRYLDNGMDQGTSWRAVSFPDGGWASGPAPLGYSDDTPLTTTLEFGGDPAAKHPTYYFRHTFNVSNPGAIGSLRASVRRDDGIVAYLNGTEVFRDNMPEGAISYTNLSAGVAADDGAGFHYFNFSGSLLQSGNNVLAVEIHQQSASSSDIVFDAELIGNPQPLVSILSHTNGQEVTAANLVVSGSAVPGGGSVTLVELFADGNPVGQSTDADWTIVWNGVTPGNYDLTARVTDSSGLMTTSDAVNVTVQALPPGTLVPFGSVWRYFLGTDFQEASIPSTAWRQAAFDDSSWSEGAAFIGYGEGDAVTTIPTSAVGDGNYLSLFVRKTFNVANANAYEELSGSVIVDDGAVVYINGTEVGRINTPAGELTSSDAALVADERRTLELAVPNPASILVPGQNVLAIHVLNGNQTSSDILVDATLSGTIDTQAPFIDSIFPLPTATVLELNSIDVFFSEEVVGANASDLLVNGEPATDLTFGAPGQLTFQFTQPATGQVSVAFIPNHGITDASPLGNPFDGASWTYTLDPNAEPLGMIISEFMASNDDTINDEDGDSSDWIELYNAGSVAVNLGGWHLTDDAGELDKWTFPDITVLPNQFLLVFASSKDRTNATGRLHTNFGLSAGGEYLALVDADLNVVSEFAPVYPEQLQDISYGRDSLSPDIIGFFEVPTPGDFNDVFGGSNVAPPVEYSMPSRTFFGAFNLTLSTPENPAAEIRYVIVNNGASASLTNIPSQGSSLYTGPIAVNGTMQVRARAFVPNYLPGPPRTESYVQLNENLRTFSSDLPLTLIHNFGTGQFPGGGGSTTDRSSIVMIFDTKFGRSSLTNIPDTVSRAGINLRGSSTQGYPKSSYAVEFWDEYNQDIEKPVLDMAPESDWVYYAPNQFDIPMLHNPIAYELSNDVGQWASKTRMVEVFLNTAGGAVTGPAPGGNYHGIYVLEEKIKRDDGRLDLETLEPEHNSEPEITGGYIMKVDRVDANERTFSAGGLNLIYVEPDGLEMVTPQRSAQATYIRNYVNGMNTAMGNGTYEDWIDVQGFIDHNLLVMFPMNVDGLRLSGYMHKPRDQVDRHGQVIKPGKFNMGPVWDFDRAMGSTRGEGGFGGGRPWDPEVYNGQNPNSTNTSGDPGTPYFDNNGVWSNPWYRQLFLDLDFWQKYIDRYQELSDTVFSLEHISAIIDRYGAELAEAQPRDLARWGGQGGSNITPRSGTIDLFGYSYTFDGTYQGELDFLKQWFADRIAFLDEEFLDRPFLSNKGADVQAGFELTITGPPGATIYYTLDGTDPRAPGGSVAPGAMAVSGPIVINDNARVVARSFDINHNNSTGYAPNGVNNPPLSSHWSGPRAATFVVRTPSIRITEVMYHPLPAPIGSEFFDEDFEYIEVQNVGNTPVNLLGYKLSGGVDFTFPNTVLNPGEFAVVSSYVPAFESRYGALSSLAGAYTGLIANQGEDLVLEGRLGEVIHEFEFADGWYPSTDGFGFALVIRDPDGALENWNSAAGWRAGTTLNGTPGAPEPADPDIPAVYVNEALTHTDAPDVDAVELFNPNAFSVDLGGWFLSDDYRTPQKYEIPPGTSIPANGYLVFTEEDFNPAMDPNAFNLRSSGDEIYLYSGDGAGNLTGYIHGFDFGASLNGVAFGRYVNSEGDELFVSQSANTLGAANAGPAVGPIVISEIMYHPPDIVVNGARFNNDTDEYVELTNLSGATVPLFDPNAPTNSWRLRDAADFAFPPNTTMNPGERLLVVSFDPQTNAIAAAAFRNKFGIAAGIRLFGPLDGNLSNGAEDLELVQPDVVRFYDTNIVITAVIIDKVDYEDTLPWPPAADGAGPALHRLVNGAFGNDAANWTAAPPNPGSPLPGGNRPFIGVHPVDMLVLAFQNVTFSVAASGSGPLQYQWLFNGGVLEGATNASLELSSVQPAQAGVYQALVFNNSGSAVSEPASLEVFVASVIEQQPRDLAVSPGASALFSVIATSSSAITYQWRKNGVPIPGATSPSYRINVVAREDDGIYDVLITDDVGTIASQPARLFVLVNPTPLYFSRTNYVIRGQDVTLSVQADGTLPMTYEWRRISTPVYEDTRDSLVGLYTLRNVPASEDGVRYLVVLRNIANPTVGRVVGPMYIGVLEDTDGDGMDDDYEDANGFSPTNPADAQADDDLDGVINRDEYVSGTDPNDANSYLKVEEIGLNGRVNIRFMAQPDKSYTVLYKDRISDAVWLRLTDVASSTTGREVVLEDSPGPGSGERYYQLVTPVEPLPIE